MGLIAFKLNGNDCLKERWLPKKTMFLQLNYKSDKSRLKIKNWNDS